VKREHEQVRHIAKAFTHEEALTIARALTLASNAAPAMDDVSPSPETRAFGRAAGEMAELFHRANGARTFIEGAE
jgi:hypothetical protein